MNVRIVSFVVASDCKTDQSFIIRKVDNVKDSRNLEVPQQGKVFRGNEVQVSMRYVAERFVEAVTQI